MSRLAVNIFLSPLSSFLFLFISYTRSLTKTVSTSIFSLFYVTSCSFSFFNVSFPPSLIFFRLVIPLLSFLLPFNFSFFLISFIFLFSFFIPLLYYFFIYFFIYFFLISFFFHFCIAFLYLFIYF